MMNEILAVNVMELLNNPAIIAFAAMVLVVILNFIYGKKPILQQFEGTFIAAVKFAEKMIDDNTENKGARRLDEALKFTIKVFKEKNKGKNPSPKIEQEMKEAIQVTHANLEVKGTLKK